MSFKVGEKVLVKNLEWYYKNCDKNGYIKFSRFTAVGNECAVYFTVSMSKFCSSIVTIKSVIGENCYYINEDDNYWVDDMFDCKVSDKPNFALGDVVSVQYFHQPFIIKRYCGDDLYYISDENGNEFYSYGKFLSYYCGKIVCVEGYEFKDENGNVINTNEITLEKKQNKYPKSYDECIEKLSMNWGNQVLGYKSELLNNYQKLFICRDFYWRIAGEEMGLDKSWEPDWNDNIEKYCIIISNDGLLLKGVSINKRVFLSFPSAEIRDMFMAAFSDIISDIIRECKEML